METGSLRHDHSLLRLAAAGALLLLVALPPRPLLAQSDDFHDLIDEGTIVDPFQLLLTEPGPAAGSVSGQNVATATVVDYCADSEGCRVRLVFTSGPFNPTLVNSHPLVVTRTLLVTPDGDRWNLFTLDGNPLGNGKRSDAALHELMELTTLGGSICRFEEHEDMLGFVRYHLAVELGANDASVGASATCRLIVSD